MVCGGDNFYCLIFIYWFEREREEWRWGGRQEERQRDSNLLFHLFIHSIGWFLYVPWMGITSAALLYRDDTLTHWATWPGWYHILNLVGLVAERRIHLLQGLSIKIDLLSYQPKSKLLWCPKAVNPDSHLLCCSRSGQHLGLPHHPA